MSGRSIPHAGLRSSCPSAGPRSMACVPGSSLRRLCPSRHRCLMDDHACRHCARRRSTRPDWRLAQIKRYVIPVWQRRCPRNSWHDAHYVREIMVSVKLLYSRKTVWCWFPRGCADQRGSFVKLRLLSNLQRSRRRPVAVLHQHAPDYMTLLFSLLPGCRPSWSYMNREWVKNQCFEIRTSFNIPTNCVNDNRPIPMY